MKLTDEERSRLAGLVGRSLKVITANTWSAEIRCPDFSLNIEPEEVATPDHEHPLADVERPKVLAGSSSRLLKDIEYIVAEDLGCVIAVNIFRVLVSFSPCTRGPAIKLRKGGEIPEWIEFGWIYHKPSEREQAIQEISGTQALVDLEIGFELVTRKCPSIVFYTIGFFIGVSVGALPREEEWVELGVFTRHGLCGDTGA
ncbi:MAG: hypothetical protein JSV89_17475 [Spirochaetaceae bacterium]|nr:MAG: hypothetical protein JSV89_17475 [Spirochaetaceae bacterium]